MVNFVLRYMYRYLFSEMVVKLIIIVSFVVFSYFNVVLWLVFCLFDNFGLGFFVGDFWINMIFVFVVIKLGIMYNCFWSYCGEKLFIMMKSKDEMSSVRCCFVVWLFKIFLNVVNLVMIKREERFVLEIFIMWGILWMWR